MNFVRMLLRRVRFYKNIDQDKQFWLGQIFMILATVLGVYLAAQVGFKQAINYENLIGEKDKYYMTLSLQDEIKDTIKETNQQAYNKSKQIGANTLDLPSFYVWETMKRSSETLEIPSGIITGTRRYIHQITKLYNQFNHKQLGGYVLNKQIKQINENIAKNLLPKIEKYNSKLKKFLIKKDIL